MGFIVWLGLGLLAGSCYYLLYNSPNRQLLMSYLKLGITGAFTGGVISNLILHEPLGSFSFISLDLIWFSALASVYFGDQLRSLICILLTSNLLSQLNLKKLFPLRRSVLTIRRLIGHSSYKTFILSNSKIRY